jgi:hypothetical protein
MNPKSLLDKVPPIRTPGSIAGLFELMQNIPERATIAEIGCYAGESTEVLASKASVLVCVDPWVADNLKKKDGESYIPSEITIQDIEAAFKIRMAPWREYLKMRNNNSGIRVFKGNSVDVAITFDDMIFDLGYIDADHFYPSVCADIRAWLPKIKIGGFIGGHDYNDEQWSTEINRAVDELLGGPDMTFQDCSWLKRITEENRMHFLKWEHIDGPKNEVKS